MKSTILKITLLILCFSTVIIYGQNKLPYYESGAVIPNTSPTLNTKQSTNGNAIKLDSIVGGSEEEDYYREEFTYDSNGNLILFIGYEKNGISEWVAWGKYEYSYDINGNLILEIHSYRENNVWVADCKIEFAYDIYGNMVLEIWYWKYGSPDWIAGCKRVSSYGTNGNLIFFIQYDYDLEIMELVASFKDEYSYDTNGNKILVIHYYREHMGTELVALYKHEYSYDSNRDMILEILFHRENNEWVIEAEKKYSYSYDANENLILWIMYGKYAGEWIIYEQSEYSYDSNGNLTLEICYKRDYWGAELVAREKNEYSYDSNGNRILEIQYFRGSLEWVLNKKYEYTFDFTYLITDLVYPKRYFYKDYNFDKNINIPLEAKMYSWYYEFPYDEPVWKLSVATFHYSTFTISVSETISTDIFSIYPNPTNNSFIVDYNRAGVLKLYDMLGKEVLTQIIYGKTEININHLPKGIYGISIISERKVIGNSKIVKQ
jgi:uncharacterized protein YkuJ